MAYTAKKGLGTPAHWVELAVVAAATTIGIHNFWVAPRVIRWTAENADREPLWRPQPGEQPHLGATETTMPAYAARS